MKVKILANPYIKKLEAEINEFTKGKNIIDLHVDTTSDNNGYLVRTATILYTDGE
ncbi:hypothetical protein [Culicoidibacter larvae]|uniref:hypothetical protein n=1 Tax=Culicoidibacter larvae TaxID=2579976 RepID=UPI001484CF2A|nr:hypothetical protein [Culicoidibacter larvae]